MYCYRIIIILRSLVTGLQDQSQRNGENRLEVEWIGYPDT